MRLLLLLCARQHLQQWRRQPLLPQPAMLQLQLLQLPVHLLLVLQLPAEPCGL
jgi:hypothetical protein